MTEKPHRIYAPIVKRMLGDIPRDELEQRCALALLRDQCTVRKPVSGPSYATLTEIEDICAAHVFAPAETATLAKIRTAVQKMLEGAILLDDAASG